MTPRLQQAVNDVEGAQDAWLTYDTRAKGGGYVQTRVTAQDNSKAEVVKVLDGCLRAIAQTLGEDGATVSVTAEAVSADGSIQVRPPDLGLPSTPSGRELYRHYGG